MAYFRAPHVTIKFRVFTLFIFGKPTVAIQIATYYPKVIFNQKLFMNKIFFQL